VKLAPTPWHDISSSIPDPTPDFILRKYVGIFRTADQPGSVGHKTNKTALIKHMLCLTRIPAVERPVLPAVKEGRDGAAKVTRNGKKNIKAPAKTPAKVTKKAAVQGRKNAALNALAATLDAKPNLVAPTAEPATPAPAAPSTTSLAVTMTKKPSLIPSGLAYTPSITPATKPSVLYLACNGVAQVRVSGATPKETESNTGLQVIGLLWPENAIVTFDVKDGGVVDVRWVGDMYGREGSLNRKTRIEWR
jgi:hypothetical protein